MVLVADLLPAETTQVAIVTTEEQVDPTLNMKQNCTVAELMDVRVDYSLVFDVTEQVK